MDGYWFSVLSYPCANQLGPRWLGKIWFIFSTFSPPGLPQKKCWYLFLDQPNHINTTPFHPLAYLPTTNPSPFFSHLSFHLHISNDLVSSPPTYLPTYPPIYLPSDIHIPTHLPLHTYQCPPQHKCEEMLIKPYVGIAIHVAPSKDKIQWRYCISSCKWLCHPSTFIPTSHPK
jgi:hypothetical protein